jgi:hypothetical protein
MTHYPISFSEHIVVYEFGLLFDLAPRGMAAIRFLRAYAAGMPARQLLSGRHR